MPFDPTGRPLRERKPRQSRRFDAAQLRPSIGNGNDDHADLVDAVGTVADVGGGELLIPTLVHIGSDLVVPRSVVLVGHEEAVSQIRSTGTQRRVKVTGVPSTAPDWAGDSHIVSHLTFDNVSLDFGPNSASGDSSRGCRAFQCQFVNSDRGLSFDGLNADAFAGVGAIQCKFRVMGVGILFNNGGPAHFVQACDISECEHAAIEVNGVVADGLSLFVHGGYSDHCARFLKTHGTMSGDGNIYVNGWGIELCGTSDAGQLYPSGTTYGGGQYADGGYGIENDGCQVWLENMNFFQGTHTDALFWSKSGVIYVGSGRYFWNNNAFCRPDGGRIVVDQNRMFSPSKVFGVGVAGALHHTSTTGGGKISAPRSGFVAEIAAAKTTLTNAVPNLSQSIAQPYDDNNRIIEFDIQVTGIGTSNTLRCQLADGSHTISVDLVFPLIRGGGHVTITWIRTQWWAAMCTYSLDGNAAGIAHAAGGTPTAAEFNAAVDRINGMVRVVQQTTGDPSNISAERFLSLTTINSGGTASQMNIYNYVERVMGPHVLGI